MDAIVHGNSEKPLLVCCHGLLGGPEDFAYFKNNWGEHFQLVLLDMDKEARTCGFKDNSGAFDRLCYDQRADEVVALLKENFPNQKAYFAGISIGGKVVFEIAGKFPEVFMGGVVTDQGVGSMVESDLCLFIENVVPTINLTQPWKELRQEIKTKIPDPKLRILIQTQLNMPKKNEQATWKPELECTRELLSSSSIESQWHLLPAITAPITVLKATDASAISQGDYLKMKQHPWIHFIEVPGSNHFLHISHPEMLHAAVMALGKQKSARFQGEGVFFQDS